MYLGNCKYRDNLMKKKTRVWAILYSLYSIGYNINSIESDVGEMHVGAIYF